MNLTFDNETKNKSFIVYKVIIGNEPPIWYEIRDKDNVDKGDTLKFSMDNIRVSSKVVDITKLEDRLYFSLGSSLIFKNELIKLSRYKK